MADTPEIEAQSGHNMEGNAALKNESSSGGGDANLDTSSKMDPFTPKKRNRSYSQEPEVTESKRKKGVAPIKAEYVDPTSPTSTPDN
jgi:hypothetical protein